MVSGLPHLLGWPLALRFPLEDSGNFLWYCQPVEAERNPTGSYFMSVEAFRRSLRYRIVCLSKVGMPRVQSLCQICDPRCNWLPSTWGSANIGSSPLDPCSCLSTHINFSSDNASPTKPQDNLSQSHDKMCCSCQGSPAIVGHVTRPSHCSRSHCFACSD